VDYLVPHRPHLVEDVNNTFGQYASLDQHIRQRPQRQSGSQLVHVGQFPDALLHLYDQN
jgi:hypothetical protein